MLQMTSKQDTLMMHKNQFHLIRFRLHFVVPVQDLGNLIKGILKERYKEREARRTQRVGSEIWGGIVAV